MKLLKSKFSVFIVFLLINLSAQCYAGVDGNTEGYSSYLANEFFVEVKLERDKYWFRIVGSEWVLLKEGVQRGGRAKEVLFMDVNDNDVKDVFLKVFEAGSNSLYALFITEIRNGSIFFVEQDELFGSPYANKQGQLVSVKREGPFSTLETYKGYQGRFYKLELREPINSDLERVTIYDKGGVGKFSVKFLGSNINAGACVVVERVQLSNTPSVSKDSQAYLVKGDVVSILDVQGEGEWLKVLYSAGNIIEAWVPQDSIELNEAGHCEKS
jgi:hypothetical protein